MHAPQAKRRPLDIFGQQVTQDILFSNEYYSKWIDTSEISEKGFEQICIVFSSATDNEGDYGITVITNPIKGFQDTLRLARINFIFTQDQLTITGLQGSVSSDNIDARRRFGAEFLQNAQLFKKLKKTFGNTKPLNFLIDHL